MKANSTTHSWTSERSSRLAQAIAELPAAYFEIILGIVGLASACIGAEHVWQIPESLVRAIYCLAGVLWVGLVTFYVARALFTPTSPRRWQISTS